MSRKDGSRHRPSSRLPMNGWSGYCHFPDHYEEKYFDMLTAEEKKKTRNKRTGRSTYEWVKIRERTGALDCRIGNMAMVGILNPNFNKIKLKLDMAVKRMKSQEKQIPQEKPIKKTRRLLRSKSKPGGWLSRYR